MIKMISRTLAVFTAIIVSISCFSLVASAQSYDLKLDGPAEISAGTEIEISLSSATGGLYGVSGVLQFDPDLLVFEDASPDISGWSIDFNNDSGELAFACSDEWAKKAADANKSMVLFTFSVVDLGNADKVTVKATSLKVSDGNNLVSVADFGYSIRKPSANNKPQGSEELPDNNYIVITDTTNIHNNFLQSLVIEGVEITPEFTPENKKYEATVPYEVEGVKVTAVPQAENATVTISGTELEYVGTNIVKVVVISESGLKRTYKVYIKRNAPETSNSEVNKEFPVYLVFVIVGAGIALLACVILIIFIIRKKKSKV